MAAHDRTPSAAPTAALDAATRALSDGYMAGLSYGAALPEPPRPAYPGEPAAYAAIRERVEQSSADRLAALEECRAAFRVIEISLRSGDPASVQDALETAITYGGLAAGFVEEALRRIYGQPPALPPGVASLDDERVRRAGRRA